MDIHGWLLTNQTIYYFQHEVAALLKLGALRSNLIYAQPCKQESHILFAKEQDAQTMTFDNEDELVKIKKLYPEAR